MTSLSSARVLARHGRRDPAEWARAIHELADLSDEQIEDLVEVAVSRRSPAEPVASAR